MKRFKQLTHDQERARAHGHAQKIKRKGRGNGTAKVRSLLRTQEEMAAHANEPTTHGDQPSNPNEEEEEESETP